MKSVINLGKNFLVYGVISMVVLAGCGQSSSLQNKTADSTKQVQTLQPSAETQKNIDVFRAVFIERLQQAEQGLQKLSENNSQNDNSPLAKFSKEDAGIRYDTAIHALYANSELSTEVYNTLMDMNVFVPDVFLDIELNKRLQYHSPALARLVNQHLVWKQLEITRQQQVKQLQVEQEKQLQVHLEQLNQTIENYDKQIAEYQTMLKDIKKEMKKS